MFSFRFEYLEIHIFKKIAQIFVQGFDPFLTRAQNEFFEKKRIYFSHLKSVTQHQLFN